MTAECLWKMLWLLPSVGSDVGVLVCVATSVLVLVLLSEVKGFVFVSHSLSAIVREALDIEWLGKEVADAFEILELDLERAG